MKVYSDYKEAEIRWINNIPKHWDVKPLFSLMSENKEINTGNVEQNVLSLSYGNIIRRDLSKNFGLIPESFEGYQIVYPNYIVLRLTDLQNDWNSLRVGLVKEKGIITAAYAGLILSEQLYPKFAYYLLHAYDLLKVFYGEGAGVRQSMSYKDLRRMPILFPPFPEQQAIADFLDRKTAQIDTLIEKKQRQIDLLQEQRTALINHVVTKGLNPNTKMKDSGVEWLGEIPSHWETKSLKHLVSLIIDNRGRTPPFGDNGIPMLEVKQITEGDRYPSDSFTKFVEDEIASQYIRENVKEGDILLSTVGATSGRAVLVAENPNYFIAQNVIGIRTADDVDNVFLYYLITSYYFFNSLLSINKSNTIDNLKVSVFINNQCVVPPTQEQREIAKFLDKETVNTTKTINKIQQEIEFLKEYRTALISEAVTGKIDVRTAE